MPFIAHGSPIGLHHLMLSQLHTHHHFLVLTRTRAPPPTLHPLSSCLWRWRRTTSLHRHWNSWKEYPIILCSIDPSTTSMFENIDWFDMKEIPTVHVCKRVLWNKAHVQSEALKKSNEAIPFERDNLDMIFELRVHYAEHQNLNVASHYTKRFIDATGGSIPKD